MNEKTLALEFHRDTIHALRALEAERNHPFRRWFLFRHVALLYQVVGAGIWLVSAHVAAALAVTGIFFSLYCAVTLNRRARRYAKLEMLSYLDEAARFTAATAWRRLGIMCRIRALAFGNLCAGMTWVSVWEFVHGHPVSSPLMDWIVIAGTFMNLLMLLPFRDLKALKPLLDRLSVAANSADNPAPET